MCVKLLRQLNLDEIATTLIRHLYDALFSTGASKWLNTHIDKDNWVTVGRSMIAHMFLN